MAMALRSAEYSGHGHSVQFGAGFFPSLLLDCLPSQEIFPDENMDGCVFRWTMGSRHASLDSEQYTSEMGRIFLAVEHCNHRLHEFVFRNYTSCGHECSCFSV